MKTTGVPIAVLGILFAAAIAAAQPAKVWRTGQTTCYEENGNVINCSGTGQDGDVQAGVGWPEPRFEDNGDGTVTDHLTGLIWLKNVSCFGVIHWADALAACNMLASGACGLSDGSVAGDWRLPNRKELFSLIDFSRSYPALPQGHLFTNLTWTNSWSASTSAEDNSYAWCVNLDLGNITVASKVWHGHGVWPVRGGQGGLLGNLTISTPNGGETLFKGQDQSITWTSTGVTSDVAIDLYKGGTGSEHYIMQLAAAAPNTGNYPFNPPENLVGGDDYLIGISGTSGTVFDFSDAFFSIWNEFDALVTISRKTDLNKDGDNDGSDIAIFLAAYGSHSGDVNYNIDADFDKDNDVDQIDLGTFSRVFGCTDLPIILPNIPVLDQTDYTTPERVETYVESVDNISAGGCVPVSFAMLFLGHYKEFGPSFPTIDISNSSENTKNLMDDITKKISIPIPQDEWQDFIFWSDEQTTINALQILDYMDNYSFAFENTDYLVETAWNIEYECSTAISNDQLIKKVIERLNNNEPIFFIGDINKNDVGDSGGHVSIISGYAKLDGIEYFRVNDTYSNISAPWYRAERGDACVVNQNCSPNYCPLKLIWEDRNWVFEIRSFIAWPQTLVFTVLPKF